MGETFDQSMVQIKTEPQDDYQHREAYINRQEPQNDYFYSTVKLEPVDDDSGEEYESYVYPNEQSSPSLDSPELRRILSQPQSMNYESVNFDVIRDPSLNWVREHIKYRQMSAWEQQLMHSMRPPEKPPNIAVDNASTDYENGFRSKSARKDSPVVRSLLTAPLSSFPQPKKRKSSLFSTQDATSPNKKPSNSHLSMSHVNESRFKKTNGNGDLINNGAQREESSHLSGEVNTRECSLVEKSDKRILRSSASRLNKGSHSLLSVETLKANKSAILTLLTAPITDVKPELQSSLPTNDTVNGCHEPDVSGSTGKSSVIRSLLSAPMSTPNEIVVKSEPESDVTNQRNGNHTEDPIQSKIRALLSAPLPPPKPNPLADKPVLMNLLKEALPISSQTSTPSTSTEVNLSTSYHFSETLRRLLSAPPSELVPVEQIADGSVFALSTAPPSDGSGFALSTAPHSDQSVFALSTAPPSDRSVFALSTAPHSDRRDNHFASDRIKAEPLVYECDRCDKQFADSEQLWQHSLLHEEDSTVMCFECGDEFPGMESLWYHKTKHHQPSTSRVESVVVKSENGNHGYDYGGVNETSSSNHSSTRPGPKTSVKFRGRVSDFSYVVERNKDYDSD